MAYSDKAEVVAQAEHLYPTSSPKPGWAEQDPAAWWDGTVAAIHAVRRARPDASIEAIGISGQMHSSVFLDKAGDQIGKQADYWVNGPKAIKVDNGPSLYDDKGKSLRPTQKTVVDARGSKFEIKLDVRNDNPDRIVRRVFDGIGRAAARPISSSYGPPSKGW